METTDQQERPVVLCVGGHDPSGGAGILADAESVLAASAFPVTVVTALTDQDSCGLRDMRPQPYQQLDAQCRRIIADSAPRALKLGLLASSGIVRALSRIIDEHPELPVVLDPVLATGAGQHLVDAALLNQLRKHLLHRCSLLTPNLPEARTLSTGQSADDCATRLLSTGVRWVLITGTHDDTEQVTNRLYSADGDHRAWDWPRLPGDYHGSGCTLASAIAVRLAWGMEMEDAVASAQSYTWESLKQAFRTGRCQLTPNRLHHFTPHNRSQ
ncbi:hydroxymethylpyrimidine/phosphomethylpyrimidine kinase [Thiorhodococcus mannitoliphagus]|uniref:hydroxymethylpyrimidine kinase n=1 Tax=Thiorhodococcus mannitoliphagus TaxID=329406 RepID=A0A6P1DSD8_9GAMM|nr:hydroxymethylpyrimidine/phosphomethylpyrimidine kinase [Thiorhodococcus mannitoliphagus]NEX21197.1 hydroxymethylpyrimidine/phosphomethylpyrimidine kinase [Thiorhodococcus mannitoliphagus]